MDVCGVLVLPRTVFGVMTVYLGAGGRFPQPLDVVDVGHVRFHILAARGDVVHREFPAGHRRLEMPVHARAHGIGEELNDRFNRAGLERLVRCWHRRAEVGARGFQSSLMWIKSRGAG